MKPHHSTNDDYLDEYLRRANDSESTDLSSEQDHVEHNDQNLDAETIQEKPKLRKKTSSAPEISSEDSTEEYESIKQKQEEISAEKNSIKSNKESLRVKKSNRRMYTIAALVIVIAGFLIGYYRHKHAVMQRILVEGNYYTSQEAIIAKANIPADVSPDSVDLSKVIASIEKLPFIKLAEVSVIPPSQIKISVTERKPVALLLDGAKKALVDQHGIILPQLHSKTPNVPLLYGFTIAQVGDTLNTTVFADMSQFLSALEKYPLSNATISELAWNSKNGVVAMSTENGIKLIFGRENPENALKSWESYYTQIVPKQGLNDLSEVDLRYNGLVITR